MALALNNLKRVDMPLNKETKPNQLSRNANENLSKKKDHSYLVGQRIFQLSLIEFINIHWNNEVQFQGVQE